MRKFEKTILIPVLVVFLAVMTVVFISFLMTRNSVQRELDQSATEYADATTSAVSDRLNIFEETLHAGLGLFAGGPVSKEQFSQFINTSAVLERYPGAQSVAYAKVVSSPDIDGFVNTARGSINPDFALYPAGNRGWYAPVIYIEPQSDSNKQVIGFDILSEKKRLEALERARDTGQITLTEAIQSSVDPSDSGRAFVMYAPQYKRGMPLQTVEQRREAIEGFIYAGFRVSSFMENVVRDAEDMNISFTLNIKNDNTQLYKSPEYDAITATAHDEVKQSLTIGNNAFEFTFAYNGAGLLSNTNSRPLAILLFGTVTALLIALAIWLILRGKANELLLEQERGINEAKDNLLSLASHQLRTPATGVKQYLGMLIQGFAGKLTPQQKQLLEQAYAGNERQLKTINDVLYLARLGSGRIMLSKTHFLIRTLIEDVIREVNNEAKAKKHKITFEAPKTKREIYGDPHMIRMAVENLITNAIKYTTDGGKIVVRLKHGKNMRIEVEDNGIGIDESQQDKLFEQFERIDNDLSIAVGGSGIGLYVVRNIAGMHDGHVEVSSELGKGSQFTIVLPYGKPDES